MVTGVAAVGILTTQPNLYEVVETAIFIDLPGVQMAVIVSQRQGSGIGVIQMLCGRGFQDKILVHKGLHFVSSFA
jgi:hypothetical protein